MEPVREPPWAEHEKVYLLAEIIKGAQVPSHVVFSFLRELNLQPRWNETALPHGRSVRSSQTAYNDMAQTYPASDHRQRPQYPPALYPGTDPSKKRPLQPETATPIGRLLQPRPPSTYPSTEFMGGPSYVMSPVGEPANKKKRGRPTKAEAQARADAAAARGEVYPPPRKARTSGPGPEAASQETRPFAMETPPVSTPGPLLGATTPQEQQQQQQQAERSSESSSGKKKRSKPTPLELEKPHRDPRGTESPLAFGSLTGGQRQSQAYSSFTPISAPLPSAAESRDRDKDIRMEGVEESQPRTTTPHSFKDTVGI
ncbi:hypothetical protein EJ04DRAFT_510731 [Polyplosphaeria fusca]|uniref:AT hook domain-containing protein n=1 Tax=Polyplosphaeria fusca TaxID=682080 RepID=A0A9P4R4K0_9PLEO|nr:hypothetical protein EJ04DRAFT_510731 [Polyplosphaeria fusca]